MQIDSTKLLETMAQAVFASAEELTELDSAIGDADHGLNMKRGFQAVLDDRTNILSKPLPEAIKAMGYTLVMKIGGASGPLYGTLFMTLGKDMKEHPSTTEFGHSLAVAADAVCLRGKAEIGNKTMVDVLLPVAAHIASGTATIESVRHLAADCAKATVPMKALRGRASFLGERSIGHMDPGARSCEILIDAVCDVLAEKQ
jgi:dihydroxyacetone kinase-like protein